VPSIWQKLTGARRPALVCYLRENGPIAYELPLFATDPRATVEAMLATGLAWFWRAGDDSSGGDDWTQLTRWSLAAFLPDVERGGVLAIGIDPSDAPAGTTDRAVAGWLRPFCGEQPGPAQVFIARTAGRLSRRSAEGATVDRVFVAQQPPEAIRELLQALGIDRGKAERRAYARLRGESLEDIVRAMR